MSIQPNSATRPAAESPQSLEHEGFSASIANGCRPIHLDSGEVFAATLYNRCFLCGGQFCPAPIFAVTSANSRHFCRMLWRLFAARPICRHFGAGFCALFAAFASKADFPHSILRFLSVMCEHVFAVGRASFKIINTVISAIFVLVVDYMSRWNGAINRFPYDPVLKRPSPEADSGFNLDITAVVYPLRSDRKRFHNRHYGMMATK